MTDALVGVVVPASGGGDKPRTLREALQEDGWRAAIAPAAPPAAPTTAAAAAGIIGKTIESGIKRGVVLAVQYDHQEGRWYALVQLDDGSFENFSLYAAKVVP